MQGTINQILAVKVTEQIFDVDNLRPGRTWVMELTGDGICTYYTEYKSRKKLGVSDTPMSKREMDAFFLELYDFARSAEESYEALDDCSHKVTFIYGPMHKEIFEGETVKGRESLIGMIREFIDLHR